MNVSLSYSESYRGDFSKLKSSTSTFSSMESAKDCRGVLTTSVFWTRKGHCTRELPAVAGYPRPVQGQAGQNPSTNEGGAYEIPLLPEELPAVDCCWGRRNQLPTTTHPLWSYPVSRGYPYTTHILAALNGFSVAIKRVDEVGREKWWSRTVKVRGKEVMWILSKHIGYMHGIDFKKCGNSILSLRASKGKMSSSCHVLCFPCHRINNR